MDILLWFAVSAFMVWQFKLVVRFYSTVHGAWWSGVKLADMLVAKHKDST